MPLLSFFFSFYVNAVEAVVLGFQHYILTLGTAILIPSMIVPQMGGGNVSIQFYRFGDISLLIFLIFFIYYIYLLSLCCFPQLEKARVIQTFLFVSGLSTLLQSLFGTRLPTVVVGSYSYVVPTTSVLLATRYSAVTDPHEVLYF